MAASRDVPLRRQAETGARLAAANARRLLDASRRLGEEGDYGPAASLAVFAGEESIKALALMAWSSELPIPTEKQLGLVLRHHEPRHLAAGMLVGAGEMMVALIAGIFAAIAKKAGAGSDADNDKERWSRAAWWSEADTLKNRGFYVEFDRGKWKTPADLKNADFERAHEMAAVFVRWLEEIVEEDDPAVRQEIVTGGPGMS